MKFVKRYPKMVALLSATLLIAFTSFPAFAGGAREAPRQDAKETPLVAVSVLPQQYFAQRVAGDRAQVMVLVGPGQSPHSYEPSPRQMAQLGSAKIWFTTGVEFEIALEPKIRAQYPSLRIVDSTEGISYRTLEAHHHEGEETEEADHDEEGTKDPHVWLGKEAAKIEAAHMRDALVALDPEGEADYGRNYDAFASDVDALFDGLKKDLASMEGSTVFVFHPSFGYLFDELGITQEAVETGGKEPTPKAIAKLIEEAKADGVKVIFVQKQFSKTAARSIAEAIGGTVEELDPLAPDWMDNIRRMGEVLKRSTVTR